MVKKITFSKKDLLLWSLLKIKSKTWAHPRFGDSADSSLGTVDDDKDPLFDKSDFSDDIDTNLKKKHESTSRAQKKPGAAEQSWLLYQKKKF